MCLKGYTWSKERKRKASELAKSRGFGKWMLGRHLSAETCKKMSINNARIFLGKRLSKAHRKNLSLNHYDCKEDKNPFWKGDNAGYDALHAWIKRKLGKAVICEICNLRDRKKYEWCNKDHKYHRDVKDWIQLCTSCHRKYDIENNKYSIGFLSSPLARIQKV